MTTQCKEAPETHTYFLILFFFCQRHTNVYVLLLSSCLSSSSLFFRVQRRPVRRNDGIRDTALPCDWNSLLNKCCAFSLIGALIWSISCNKQMFTNPRCHTSSYTVYREHGGYFYPFVLLILITELNLKDLSKSLRSSKI